MDIKLSEIFIGKANGLEEAEEQRFENLFYTGNKKYQQLVDNEDKFIISGRKGTGKTILAKYYEKEMNRSGIITEMITTREVVLKLFLEKGSEELEKREIELFIEYVILTEFARILIKNKIKFLNIKNIFSSYKIWRKLTNLEDLVKNRFETDNFRLTSYSSGNQETYNCSTGLTNEIGNASAGAGIADTVEFNYTRSPYYQLIETIKEDLEYLLKYVPVNIIFDDLDEFDDRIDGNSNFTKFLRVFIEKAHQINVSFRRNGNKNCRVIILLRSDIIKVLNSASSNLNKTMADCEIRLNWIKKVGSGKLHPLMDLLATKIKNSNSKLNALNNDEIIEMFFPEKINGVPVIDHMLNSSFGRPRDVINMLNIIKYEYPDDTYFKANQFKETQLEYSIKFIDELRNEMASYYESEKIEECFNIIKRVGKKSFWLSDVEQVFNDNNAKWKWFSNPKELLDIAYEFGIVGNCWPKPGAPQTKIKYNFSWKYREDGFDNPDYNKKFFLHLALRKSLLT